MVRRQSTGNTGLYRSITCGACQRDFQSVHAQPCHTQSESDAGPRVRSTELVHLLKLRPTISDEIASILDPLSNATRTALSFDMAGEDVLITGADPICIMAIDIARHTAITDGNDSRLELVRKMGATLALDVTRGSIDAAMRQLGMERGLHVRVEMSGNSAASRDMLRMLHHGGTVARRGIPPSGSAIDWNKVIIKGVTIKGIYDREMFATWHKIATMLSRELNVTPIINHHCPIADYRRVFKTMHSGQWGKVILE